MTTQTDIPNVQTIIPNGGNEVVRYFGCWLDINQTTEQFPDNPANDGPYASRKSIQNHIRNLHQCLVSEISFDPTPIPSGVGPSTSDKLAQRNLAIIESANPGFLASRRIPHTFEIRPSAYKTECDELMIDWGEIPEGSQATLYIPGLNSYEVMKLASTNYRSHKLACIDEHTLKCQTGGITYMPIPVNNGSIPGLLTIDLPPTVKKGQSFTVVVRQVTGQSQIYNTSEASLSHSTSKGWRHILGSFQLTIPVLKKEEMLVDAQRNLSNLRSIENSMSTKDRWASVFKKYVQQHADRVDALGGNSDIVVGSPTGEWEKAYKQCRLLTICVALLIAILVIAIGAFPGNLQTIGDIPVFALLIIFLLIWLKKCKPIFCKILKVFLFGTGIGTILLILYALLGNTTPNLWKTIVAGVVVTVGILLIGLFKKCFSKNK